MRALLILALFLCSPSFAYPVNYVFSGEATYIPDILNTSATTFLGSLTYDPVVDPSGPNMEATEYTVAAAGNVYIAPSGRIFGPFTDLAFTDHSVTFYDEGVRGTSYAGRMRLTFNFLADTFVPGLRVEDWPLDRFIGGTFLLADFPGHPEALALQGTINHVFRTTPVPEPSTLALFAVALAGMFVARKRRQ